MVGEKFRFLEFRLLEDASSFLPSASRQRKITHSRNLFCGESNTMSSLFQTMVAKGSYGR